MRAGVWTALLEAQCSGHQRELQPHCSCLGSSIHLVLVPAWNLCSSPCPATPANAAKLHLQLSQGSSPVGNSCVF